MQIKGFKIIQKRLLFGLFALLFLFAYYPGIASASQITARSVAIGSSLASANTTYNFTFTAPTSTTIKSIAFQACDTASNSCTQTGAASGFSSATPGSSLSQQPTGLGSGGTWAVDNSVSTALRISNGSNTGSPSAGATVNFSSVHNPSDPNSSFFIRVTTYSNADWTGSLDTGTIATSTAGQITAVASVDETLNFIIASDTVDLGTLTKNATGIGTSSFTAGTNASNGYTISYSGATLTSGSNTITAMSSAGASTMNSKQFGINLMANTTPSVGSNVSGTGTGAPSTGYGTQNQFKFNVAGEQIASASAATNDNTFTTSYIANIDSSTTAGIYSTIITFVMTANF